MAREFCQASHEAFGIQDVCLSFFGFFRLIMRFRKDGCSFFNLTFSQSKAQQGANTEFFQPNKEKQNTSS